VSSTPYRIVLVDDHRLFRLGLKAAIAPETDLQVVGEAGDAKSAVAVVEGTQPDVVVLDVSMPGADGMSALVEIVRGKTGPAVLILTMHRGIDYIKQAMASGAKGYALKDDPPETVVEGIRAVAQGHLFMSPELSHHLLDLDVRVGTTDVLDRLSMRERQVFSMIVRGHTSQKIAEELQISLKTVETHRAHINQKLGVHSTGEIVRLAALRGMLPV
jgi:DNA-binding NarL/FixJ family response regulator